MKVYFKDPFFDAQMLRALGYAFYGGSDIGECLVTAGRIAERDLDSWFDAWSTLGGRVWAEAVKSETAGHRVSAREGFLRASNYFRTATISLYGKPVDPRLVEMYRRQSISFQRAAAVMAPAGELVGIPYEDTELRGYFFPASEGPPGPTLILTTGYDGTCEEVYFLNVAAALRRGYNCLAFDGPGQGSALIEQGLPLRPDWDKVVGPAVDYALTRPEVDPLRIALIGESFGGYLALRAASGEKRLAACVADPGQFDLTGQIRNRLPEFAQKDFPDGNRTVMAALDFLMTEMMKEPTGGWALRRGLWVHGADDIAGYLRKAESFTMEGYVERITCPTLICAAENDAASFQAGALFGKLLCDKQFLMFDDNDGAGEHCEAGGRAFYHQRVFDWLDELFAR